MISIQTLSELIDKNLLDKTYTDRLSVNEVRFISCFDNALLYAIVNAVNTIICSGDNKNKFRIPLFVKSIYTITRRFSEMIALKDVNLINIVEFIVRTIIYSDIIILDDVEKIIVLELVESSLFLLTEVPTVFKKSRFNCFSR